MTFVSPSVVTRANASSSKLHHMKLNQKTDKKLHIRKQVAGGATGAVLGAVVAGPVGALVGGVIGTAVGNAAEKVPSTNPRHAKAGIGRRASVSVRTAMRSHGDKRNSSRRKKKVFANRRIDIRNPRRKSTGTSRRTNRPKRA